jgi:pentatricopeptide repeat protein
MIEDTAIYARMIAHYVSKGEWHKAFDITNKMKKDDKIDVGAYYHMLRQALEHAPEKVDILRQDMKEIGIGDKNPQLYARYISFYDSRGQLDKMLEMIEEMKKEGVVPTAQSYTRIVTRYLRDRDYTKVLETHKDMKGYNHQLTAFILPTFLDEFMSSTLPEPIYLRIGKDMRDQPGKFIKYAGHLRNIQDTARLEALDVLRKRLTLNAGFDFKHAWKNHTVPRTLKKLTGKAASEGVGAGEGGSNGEGESKGEGEGEKEKASE